MATETGLVEYRLSIGQGGRISAAGFHRRRGFGPQEYTLGLFQSALLHRAQVLAWSPRLGHQL